MSPKVTILTAVYNSASYLRKCLDSLLRQTYDNLQIICIDDASTDGSLTILQEYAARDKRIRLIRMPENGGQAKARNAGLAVAEGEYTCFVDSDDWLADDAIARVVSVFQQDSETDCVLFETVLYDQDTQTETPYPMPSFKTLTGEEAFRQSLDWRIHGVYMVRTSLHRRFPYDDTARAYSDDNTTRLHYLYSRRLGYAPGKYYYRQHNQSVTHRPTMLRYEYLKAGESMKQKLLQIGVSDRVLSDYENVRWLVLVDAYYFYFTYRNTFSKEENRRGLGEIRRVWQSIETARISPKYKV